MKYAGENNPDNPIWLLFQRLWSKAVGSADYNKKEWQELEAALFDIGCKKTYFDECGTFNNRVSYPLKK